MLALIFQMACTVEEIKNEDSINLEEYIDPEQLAILQSLPLRQEVIDKIAFDLVKKVQEARRLSLEEEEEEGGHPEAHEEYPESQATVRAVPWPDGSIPDRPPPLTRSYADAVANK